MADIIRQLRYIQEKYKNDIVSTGRVVISDLARDCADEIERLQSENRRLKKSVDNQCDDCACEIADERDKLKEEVERLKAELDKAVEDLGNLIDCYCACTYCANLMPDGTCEAERKYGVCTCLPKWRGLDE